MALGLQKLLEPDSIALIGASDDRSRVGGMPLAFLGEVGYPGRIYPVNPTRDQVQGRRAYASVRDIGEPVDLAVLTVGADHVVGALEECATAGIGHAIVFTAGFAEMGGEGRVRQDALRDVVDRTGIRVCGPNCAGIVTTRHRMVAAFGSHLAADSTLLPGPVSIISQSGAVGAYVFTLARQQGIGVDCWVTTGNEVDLQVADFIEAVAHRPETEAILLYLEEIRDGERFLRACATARRKGIRLAAIVAGRTEESVEALQSHTAAMVGDRDVVCRALEEADVAIVDSMDQLLLSTHAFVSSSSPRGAGVGLLTTSGGAGIMMLDRCVEHGVDVPTLPASVQRRLLEVLPYASVRNPVDVTGNIVNGPEFFTQCLQELLACPEIGCVVCFLGHVPLSPHVGPQLCDALCALSDEQDKPIWLVGVADPQAAGRLRRAHVPLIADPTRAIDALALGYHHERSSQSASAVLERRGDRAHREGGPHPTRVLTEVDARALLEPLGVPFPRAQLVSDGAAATRAARELGDPVVLKVTSPDLVHKADAGGVATDVTSGAAAAAFDELVARVSAAAPTARIDGVVVQEQVDGVPVIIGTKTDDVFGPVVLVGAGGVDVEQTGDTALALAPLDALAAADLVSRTRWAQRLEGGHGAPPLAKAALVELIALVSDLASRDDRIVSIELNPVLVRADGVTAVDALVEMRGAPR